MAPVKASTVEMYCRIGRVMERNDSTVPVARRLSKLPPPVSMIPVVKTTPRLVLHSVALFSAGQHQSYHAQFGCVPYARAPQPVLCGAAPRALTLQLRRPLHRPFHILMPSARFSILAALDHSPSTFTFPTLLFPSQAHSKLHHAATNLVSRPQPSPTFSNPYTLNCSCPLCRWAPSTRSP